MTKTWSFFDPETGFLLRRRFTGESQHLEMNTPEGMRPIEGRYDAASQRVDLKTGDVVPHDSPPDPKAERQERRRKARRRIARLESQQLRPMRELAIDAANDDAREKLEAIEAEIARLRNSLKAE